jgi:hypothetical protein
MNQALRQELLGRHRRRLVEILDTHGWPGRSLVGEDGAEAAWLLALHTMPDPPGAASLPDAHAGCRGGRGGRAVAGRLPGGPLSLVERNVQVYGTTICRQEDESFGPPLLEDPDHVDTRRRAVGLPPLEQDIRRIEQSYSGN